jgi:hypothetical protein
MCTFTGKRCTNCAHGLARGLVIEIVASQWEQVPIPPACNDHNWGMWRQTYRQTDVRALISELLVLCSSLETDHCPSVCIYYSHLCIQCRFTRRMIGAPPGNLHMHNVVSTQVINLMSLTTPHHCVPYHLCFQSYIHTLRSVCGMCLKYALKSKSILICARACLVQVVSRHCLSS